MQKRALGWMTSIVVGLFVPACSDTPAPTPTPDTGPMIDVGVHCRTDADCSDGRFCNGPERCLADGGAGADTRGCAPSLVSSPCTMGQVCDETAGRCSTTCPDADGDGHTAASCGGNDCDDADPHRFPGNLEVCAFDATTMMRVDPLHDEDCDTTTYADGTSGDGDQDMDGFVDRACGNRDVNGNTTRGNDCADTTGVDAMAPFTGTVAAAGVHPTEGESCNGVDDDCNGLVDDGLTVRTYYPDCDGDLFGDMMATGTPGCASDTLPPCMGHVAVLDATDCDDTTGSVHPRLDDVCDGIDNDCSGAADDSATAMSYCTTTYPSPAHATVACTGGACALTCSGNFRDCDTAIGNGCEANIQTDPAHCGSCTHACGAGATCSAGSCEHLIDIDAGAGHTCAIYASGHAVCWGRNNEGQLGDGTRTDRRQAVAVVAPVGGTVLSFTMIEAGGLRTESGSTITDASHTCAANATGFYCWGRGNEGQLGSSSTASSSAPVQVASLPYSGPFDTGPPYIITLAAGGLHSFALQREPRLSIPDWTRWGWGTNAMGELGSASPTSTSVPIQWGGTIEFDDVTAGPHHTCGINGNDGGAYCVGNNTYGQAPPSMAAPSGFWLHRLVAGGIVGSGTSGGFTQTSGAFTCSVLWPSGGFAPGPVLCWGANSEGQLGNGGTAGARVVGLTDIRMHTAQEHVLAAGGRHACAVRTTGNVVCWGHNLYGQLGDGTRTSSNRPVTVMGITTAIAVATGAEHSCAVLADGTARCWGRNDHGQLGDGSMVADSPMPVVVSGI